MLRRGDPDYAVDVGDDLGHPVDVGPRSFRLPVPEVVHGVGGITGRHQPLRDV